MKAAAFRFLFCIAGLVSCNNYHNNPIFEKHSPDSKIYRDELAIELASPEAADFTYRLDGYSVTDGKEYIDVDVTSPKVKAKAHVLVRDWHKLESIRRSKGMGYHGAELSGLKIKPDQTAGKTEFTYVDLDKIID